MANLIDLKEAAEQLGMTTDQVNDLVSSGALRSFRAGSSVKFKLADIEEYQQNAGSALDDDDDESILVSEEQLGHSGESTSSTIIGRKDKPSGDSDIQLGDDQADSDIGLGSDVELVPDSMGSGVNLVAGDSDVSPTLNTDASDVMGGSDLLGGSGLLGGDSDLVLGDDEPSDGPQSNDDFSLGDDESTLVTEVPAAVRDAAADSGADELKLSADSDIGLGDDFGGSSIAGMGDSALDLSVDDDDDLVLGGSGIGSDLSLGAGDSGINLNNPADSGINLEEEPLELGGSAIDMLELPEDDDMIGLDGDSDPDAATQLKADEEFLLTPVEDEFDDEESGSQVIALEDSVGAVDENAATMLGGDLDGLDSYEGAGDYEQLGGDEQLVSEEPDIFGDPYAGVQGGGAGAATMQSMPGPAVAPIQSNEAPYSIFNVLSLMCVAGLLLFAGLMVVDLMQNISEFDSDSTSSIVMDTVVSALNMKP